MNKQIFAVFVSLMLQPVCLAAQAQTSAASMNSVVSADQFPGADCGAKIANALSSAAGLNGNFGKVTVSQNCGLTISTPVTLGNGQEIEFIQGGTWTASCDTCFTLHYVSNNLTGPGNALKFRHTGKGDFIRWQISPYGVAQCGRLAGFIVIGTADGASGIHMGDVGGAALDDVEVRNYTNGSGIWLDNKIGWTERTEMTRVWANNNLKGFRFTNGSGKKPQASFGYTRMLDIRCNFRVNQTCMSFDGGRFYHSFVTLIANSHATPNTLIAVSGVQFKDGPGTSVDNSEFIVTGESPPGSTTLDVADNAYFNTCGFISYAGGKSKINGMVNNFLCNEVTGSFSGLYSNGQQLIAGQPRNPVTTMSPEFYGEGGLLNNGWFNGTAWQFNAKGQNNGGSAFLGTNSETANFYSVPTSGNSESPQEIPPALLNKYKIAGFNHLDWMFYRGIAPEGGGAKHRRFGGTCTTAGTPGSTCTSTYEWKAPFTDASYTPVCWGQGAKGSPILSLAASQSPNSITVQVQTATGIPSSFSGVDCVVMHD